MDIFPSGFAQTLVLGPFKDVTDFDAALPGLTIAQADIRFSIDGAAFQSTSDASPATAHLEDGYYQIPLTAADLTTVGYYKLKIAISGATDVFHSWRVVTAAVFNQQYAAGSSGVITANLLAINGDTQSAADLKDFADAGYDPGTNLITGANDIGETARTKITGGAYPLDTDANGRTRQVVGLGDGEMLINVGTVQSDLTQILGNLPAAQALRDDYNGTGFDKANSSIGTATNLTNLHPDAATQAKQDTALNRIGPWTGTGDNTVLGGIQATLRNDVPPPSDIGGGYTTTNDSQQAIAAKIDALETGTQRYRTEAPDEYGIPESGTEQLPILIYTYDNSGGSLNASTVTVTAENIAGTDRSANLDPVVNEGTGIYRANYNVASTHLEEGIIFRIEIVFPPGQNSGTFNTVEAVWILDDTSGRLTDADLRQLRYRVGIDGDTLAPSTNTPNLETAEAVWDAVRASHTGAGTFGENTGDAPMRGTDNASTHPAPDLSNLDVAVSTRSSHPAPDLSNLDVAVSTRSSHTAADAANAVMDESLVEPTGPFSWGAATLRNIIPWLGAMARNKQTQTANTKTLRNDADSGNISTAAVSDDTTTATHEKWL